MNFNSLAFAIFLPIVFVVYWAIPHKYRWMLLLISSYYFYMCWNPKYIILIIFTTVVSYFAALIIDKTNHKSKKKISLNITLIICLGVLFFFKYYNFFIENINKLISCFINNWTPTYLDLLLPVGISFYTFQTLSYVIDVYKGKIKPEQHIGIYAAYISFFPQLVAGPIERTENLLPQIKKEQKFDYNLAVYGLKQMLWGFFKKIVIADTLGAYVDATYNNLYENMSYNILLAIFFFSIQIYCDFSGYSDIAIGTAKLMGINLMKNFDSPYMSSSIKEFWSRWHISLSTWFRDYLYIPLGGNRCSKLRSSINLLITFLVSGLWHGASWTFVLWGGIHGFVQIIEKLLPQKLIKQNENNVIKKIISVIFTFIIVCISWVFFRANTFQEAIYVLSHAIPDALTAPKLLHNTLDISYSKYLEITLMLLILFFFDYFSLRLDVFDWIAKQKKGIRWLIYFIFVWLIMFLKPNKGGTEFVYFQF